MNALERVAVGAARTLKGIGGKQIVYSRRGHTQPLTAIRTVTEYRVNDAKTGLPVRMKFTDWIIVASELLLDGESIKPQAGDQITVDDLTYSVTPLDPKRGVYEPHDSAGYMINVHSVQV